MQCACHSWFLVLTTTDTIQGIMLGFLVSNHHLMMLHHVLWFLALLFFRTSYAAVDVVASDEGPALRPAGGISNDFGILQWINETQGGYVNPSQEYRLLETNHIIINNNNNNNNDMGGGGDRQQGRRQQYYGMVATQPITKGETLLRIPLSLALGINDDDDEDDPKETASSLPCSLVHALSRELKKVRGSQNSSRNSSKYAPMMRYFQHIFLPQEEEEPLSSSTTTIRRRIHDVPSVWSDKGQRLLRKIVHGSGRDNHIPPHEPTEWISLDWIGLCKGDPQDGPVALLVMQWAEEDDRLIPALSGMYNHRNGKWTNAQVTKRPFQDDVVLKAKRDIAAGEEILISENFCPECRSRHSGYGTAEIFRDYGFIEDYPQRWHYREQDVQFDIDQQDETTGLLDLTWNIPWIPQKPDEYWDMIVWLKRQIRRLQRLRNIEFRKGNNMGTMMIPSEELAVAWEFQRANIRAMAMAIKALEASAPGAPSTSSPSILLQWNESEIAAVYYDAPHYHPLVWEYDDLDYRDETCDNEKIMEFPDHRNVEYVPTPYQQMQFNIEPQTKDVVLELDHIVQIASLYRPQYHEYSVHASARFLESVQRVMFIGGGDSMLLHEVLKYSELELVVGLELDQTVTRKSFQYFQTQPHFDDPRVEWWFRDATKSLLLLTKDYWQSFDLVLVDLSETVMSLSVTDELDVFDALALLLKPEGVLVKNEQYMEHISQVFDYSLQIVYECPIICDQVMVMGSNKVDFLHAPVKDHGVPTLLYEPLVTPTNRFDYWHDYRINDARVQGKCDAPPECVIPAEEQFKSMGIMEVVDAEDIPIVLDENVVKLLEGIIAKEGLEIATSPVLVSDIILIILREGYILVRMWPSKKYCSMDINLWGRFDKLHSLRTGLTAALQSPIVSNFRVVVGGMFGSSTWSEDRNLIGPQIVQARKCDDKSPSDDDPPKGVDALPSAKDLIVAAIEESMEHIVQTKDSIAVALCGPEGDACLAADLLEKADKINKVIRLSACPNLDATNNDTMYACEVAVAYGWKKKLKAYTDNKKAQLLLVDQTAPKSMLQIVDSLLSIGNFRSKVIDKTNVVLAWSSSPDEESWRQYFLENYRRHYMHDPIRRGEFMMQASSSRGASTTAVEFGVVSCGDERASYAFRQVEASLQERLSLPDEEETSVDISLQMIYGGKYPWLEPWEPKKFLQSDYDNEAGLDQYFKQEPLAHHVVFQMEPNKEGEEEEKDDPPFEFSVERLMSSLEKALKMVQFDCPHQSLYKDGLLGDGCLVACLNPSLGTVLLTWDGRQHVDISYYRIGKDTESLIDVFSLAFLSQTNNQLQVTLQDAMPRGMGRVVNPSSDLRTPAELEDFYRSLEKSPSNAQLGLEQLEEEDDNDDDEE